jgi:release factor glutamine methyltransferase
MDIQSWLKAATHSLTESSIDSARLDAEILLADMMEKDRSWILAHPEYILTDEQISLLDKKIARRARHEPIAYIRGSQEFYGRDFIVSKDTLTPRPETETIVEMALELLRNEPALSVADIGTGSGCIIISIELELASTKNNSSSNESKITYCGYDVSERALEIARQNAEALQSRTAFEQCNILDDSEHEWQSAELLLANLPYVPDGYEINKAATHEPELALFAGKDGLDLYRALFKKASHASKHIITESLSFQHNALTSLADTFGYQLLETKDLIQHFVLKS